MVYWQDIFQMFHRQIPKEFVNSFHLQSSFKYFYLLHCIAALEINIKYGKI